MENPEPRAQYLNVVLRQIDRTSLRIPRFQRNFVWSESNIIELLESIKLGYPIGSILTWRVQSGDEYFSGFRDDPFPPADLTLQNFEVVLDGAQRLSSLYGTLRNPAAGAIYQVIYDTRIEEFAHFRFDAKVAPWQVPMSSLFESRSFLKVQSALSALPDGDDLIPRALDLYSTFQDYQVPIIALSNTVLEDVVEVFRRVNSSGTSLSSVDFVRALTWHSGFDLEETLDRVASLFDNSPLQGLEDEFLIRCLAITSNLSLDAREIVQLKTLSSRPEGLKREVDAMTRALHIMSRLLPKIGVESLAEIPYEAQRLVLFSLCHYSADVPAAVIEDWFWKSTFAEEHQSKPESFSTRLVRDVRDGKLEYALKVKKTIDGDLLARRVRRTGSAITTGFDLLWRKFPARSLISGASVDVASGRFVHLFSKDALISDPDVPTANPMLLANLVLIHEDDLERWIALRDRMPLSSAYAECEKRTGEAAAVWRSQGIVTPDDSGTQISLDRGASSVLADRSFSLLTKVIN